MDENSGRYATYIGHIGLHRYAKTHLVAFTFIAAATVCYGVAMPATGPLRSETYLYFPKKIKMHNKTYFFSCSL